MIEKQYDKVDLKIFDTRAEMGRVAAEEAASCLRELLEKEPEINCIFAAAPLSDKPKYHIFLRLLPRSRSSWKSCANSPASTGPG